MKLNQIKDQAEILALRQAYFTFEVPSNISVLMHEIRILGQTVGFVATEDFNTVGAPHLFVHEGYRNRLYLEKVEWLFKHVYCPLMKGLGKEFLVTSCSDEDDGTLNFLRQCGFSVESHIIAQYKL